MTGAPGHRWPVRVYYEDTDFSGVVYHASYLRFLERGRTEFLRSVGINQAALLAGGEADAPAGAFAVRRMTIDFLAPARMDEMLAVVSAVATVGGASVMMHQRIERDGAVLVAAVVRLGLVAGGRAIRLPPWLGGRLAATTAAP